MDRNELIQEIEGLYPADSQYSDTQDIGRRLLLEAIYNKWRELPLEILLEYAELCKNEDYRRGL